jgi:hypothetical protein
LKSCSISIQVTLMMTNMNVTMPTKQLWRSTDLLGTTRISVARLLMGDQRRVMARMVAAADKGERNNEKVHTLRS